MILLLLSLLSFAGQCAARAECVHGQRSLLLQLKQSLSMPSNQLLSWRSGSNCCFWDGVTCDSESGLVTALDLSKLNLTGFIPAEIFQLEELRSLDLSDNPMLSGVLPDFPTRSALKRLMLSSTNVSGHLPESIRNLKSLVKLDVSGCQLSGEIPNFGLSNLTILNLSNNSLSGPIPDSLFSLPALRALRLNLNQFTGRLPEFAVAFLALRVLELSSNLLEGPIPNPLFGLSELKFLGLASNNFSGTVELDMFRSTSRLTHLDLSNNRLSVRDGHGNSSLPFPKLSTLKLASCNLTTIPLVLRYQDRITTLDLSNNRIGGRIPEWIWGIREINHTVTNLNLSYNLFTHVDGSMPEYLSFSDSTPVIVDLHANMLQGPFPLPPRNTNLLDYSSNNFSSSIPYNISSYLNATTFLSLRNNSLTGEIPRSICDANRLQVLDFSYNLLTGPIPNCILENSTELIVLSLRGNQLRGSIPSNISEKCALRTINLNSNRLEGGVPGSLTNCNKLEVIDIGNNRLKDVFPFSTGFIFSLRILILRSNEFYGTIQAPPNLVHNNFTFTQLQILDLSSNHFTGSLPAICFRNLQAMMLKSPLESSVVSQLVYPQQLYQDTVVVTSKGRDTALVKILTVYKSIDFSNNRFDGDIPEDLGGLQSLCVLNLSRNDFTGPIPATFGDLVQLESLDLSANRLAGGIPRELTKLTFLSFLNLSNNELVGEIPQGNQLSTFTNASFVDNEGLCGPPLSKKCDREVPIAGTESTARRSWHESTDMVELGLSLGIGYGVGIALVFVLQSASWRRLGRRVPVRTRV